ncbi:hypothetical protein [Photorhabdus laumondii]|uniref:Photorhabdus luminescens subsp. laumondii TTO1 complete genome segment 8/17 n=1 Tax=Photorhabdus laumondii subsp. laumondii (strain DSM 15139 / CIP 105565 / TT01) TaxID=243265 RepID=Q7N508_PHOLL|nr:hypothetical protein [Photorhabdus laumondii]AWK41939.1 hypothetical protein A4R40_10790 [Photorhabdus laumondii subsp. laumondii]CAE14445.1 unnamed protein product [Photorhabdus laumondii subsp. laumondii TTO1]
MAKIYEFSANDIATIESHKHLPNTMKYGNGNGGGGGDMLEARVAKLESDVEHIKATMSDVKADLKSVISDVGTMKTDVAVIMQKLDVINNTLSKKPSEEQLNARLTKSENRFDSKFTEVEGKFDARLTKSENRFDSKFTEVEGKFDARLTKSENRFDSKFTEVEGKFDARLTKSENRFDSKLTEVESKQTESVLIETLESSRIDNTPFTFLGNAVANAVDSVSDEWASLPFASKGATLSHVISPLAI